jgi:hypothetical protein
VRKFQFGPLRLWEDGESGSGGGTSPQPTDKPAGSADDKGGDKGKGKDDSIQLSKKDYESLLRERDELRASERYWADNARSRKSEPEPKPEPEIDDDFDGDDEPDIKDDNPEKFTDDLSAEGIVALQKRGLVTKKDAKAMLNKLAERMLARVEKAVDAKINATVKQASRDAALIQKYPDLQDANSEFTQAVGKEYKALMADDPDLPKATALRMAARVVEAERRLQNGDREARILRQAGGSSRRGVPSEDDDALSPLQKQIIAKFNADGGPQITEDSYRKRAKTGVNMSARLGYTPGSMDWGE